MFSALAMKSSSAKGSDLSAVDAGLFLEGEGLQSPPLGQTGALDAPLESLLLFGVPLGSEQAEEEFLVGELAASVPVSMLLVEDLDRSS